LDDDWHNQAQWRAFHLSLNIYVSSLEYFATNLHKTFHLF